MSVGLCVLRIGVAFTGISGDTMEIQTLGKSERFVKPHRLSSLRILTCEAFFSCLGATAKDLCVCINLTSNEPHFASVRYKLLHVLEFDANRRRMSVILQTPSGNYPTTQNKGQNCTFMCMLKFKTTFFLF